MTSLDLGVYNLSLINCNKVVAGDISYNLVNDLAEYGLLGSKFSKTDCKKLLYHHVIYEFCEAVLRDTNKKKHVLFFNNTQLAESPLTEFYTEEEIIKQVSLILNKMRTMLPIKVYISRYSLPYFDHLLKTKQGRGQMLLNDIQKDADKDFDRFTFSKVKAFTKRYELTWLNNDYFNRLSTKFLLIK